MRETPEGKTQAGIDLTVVIPAYNEASKISRDLTEIARYLASAGFSYEVIVVDDGSSDSTNQVVNKLCETDQNFICLRNDVNCGKGCAVKRGVLRGRGRYIAFMDSGLCVPPTDIEKGLHYLDNGFDITIGSRALAESSMVKRQPWHRVVGGKLFALLVWYLMGLSSIRDTQCGFKFFKRDVAKDLFSELKTDGFMFDVELLRRALKKGYKIKQFPVAWSNDPDTRFKLFSGSMRNIFELLKMSFMRQG